MTLLFPLGLVALLALPLILWLHLIRERRRRVVVPSLLLWQRLPQQQEAQRRQRLPRTLLLLLHLLAAALLALALAGPQWLNNLFGREQHLVIVVDTSTSMAAHETGGTRLAFAQGRARALIEGLRANDTLALVAAGAPASVLAQGGATSKGGLLAALDGLVALGSADLPGALVLARALLDDHPTGRIVLFSDGAFASAPTPPRDRAFEWVQIGTMAPNRALTAFTARAQGRTGAAQLYARVANYDGREFAGALRLFTDERLLDTRPLSIPADGVAELTWNLPPGLSAVRAEIDGGDSLPADNLAGLSLNPPRPLRALLVGPDPGPLARALAAVPGLQVSGMSAAEYRAAPPAVDLTVFVATLPAAWPAGGVLVVTPPISATTLLEVHTLPEAANTNSARPLEPRPGPAAGALLDGLDLSSVDFGNAPVVVTPPWADVQLVRGEQPLILRGTQARSEIAVWSFDLRRGNLAGRLAFPLLVARTVRDLTPAVLPGALQVGTTYPLRTSAHADQVVVTAPGGSTTTLTTTQLAAGLRFERPGIYTISERGGGNELFSSKIAINAGVAGESDLRPRVAPSAPSPAVAGAARVQNQQQPLWPGLAGLALVVMLFEWFYVHRR